MNNKYLPIGTVVMLKGGTKRAMITGFCCIKTDDNKMYDYTGCMYPEGYISKDQLLLFDHKQIEKIFHMGLSDDEEKSFKNTLVEIVNEYNKSKNNVNNNVNNNMTIIDFKDTNQQ